MVTHVIEVEVKKFYKVYVEDETNEMTNEQAEAAARKQIEEYGEDAMCEDEEMEFEMDDIISARYAYDF